jgi:four helix bundle protein
MARDHRKLVVFNLADELALMVYRSTRFPPDERFGLQSQIRRAAISIPTNLVEGCARDTEKDFLRFVDIAFGSTREVVYLTSVSKRLGYIDKTKAAKLEELGRRIQAAIVALKAALRP